MATMGCIRVGRVDAEVVTIARVSGRHFRFYRSCGGKGRREVTRDVEDFQEAARFFCVFFFEFEFGSVLCELVLFGGERAYKE